jgi:hypothetical protein
MKKKIIYGLLLVVAMVTASSSFVSCKDYEGDDYAHWQDQLANEQIISQKSLKDIVLFQIQSLRYELTNALGNSNNGNYTDAQIQAWLNTLNGIEAGLGTNPSISDLLSALTQLNQLATASAVVNESLKDLRFAWSDSLKKAYDKAFEAFDSASYALTLAKIDSFRLDTISNRVTNLYNLAVALADSALKKTDSALNARIDSVIGALVEAYDDTDLKKQDSITAARLDSLINALNPYDDSELRARLDSLIKANYEGDTARDARIDAMYNWLDKLTGNSTIEYSYIDENGNLVTETKPVTSLQDVIEAFESTDSALQAQIDELYEAIEEVRQDIDNILGTLKKQITGVTIQSTYNPVFGSASLPFGIQSNVLAAYVGKNDLGHPVTFPTYAAEDYVSGKAVISAGDYTYLKGLGVWPAEVTLEDGQTIMAAEDNAGKVYVTVNPTNIDFSGTNFSLVNSRDEEAPVQLSALNPSTKLITWGWTRAAQQIAEESPNGFYEATANIPESEIDNVKIKVEKKKIYEALKSAWKSKTKTSVAEVAKILYNTMEQNTNHQAYGLKAEWTDTFGVRSYVSKYEIAAAAIEPLSYNAANLIPSNITRNWLPTFDKTFLAEEMHINFSFDPLIITAQDRTTGAYHKFVEVDELWLDPGLIEVYKDADGNITAAYNGYPLYYDSGSYILYGYEFRQGYAMIDFTELADHLYGKLNERFSSFETEAGNFNNNIDNMVGDINDLIGTINDYIVKMNSRINKVANSLLNGAYAMMQPALFYQAAGRSTGQLSSDSQVFTYFSLDGKAEGEITLVPSSYNFDLVTPSYKKSVIVTNVYNMALNKSAQTDGGDYEKALKEINEQLKSTTLLTSDGGMPTLKFKAKSAYKDMVFEIAYTAVDYTGHVAGRKFYLAVVE